MKKFRELETGDVIKGEFGVVYAAIANDDQEGRGPWYDKSYHETHDEALIAALNIGPMGSEGKVESRNVLYLESDEYILLPSKTIKVDPDADFVRREELRRKVLAKLSPAERAAFQDD